MGIKGLFQFLKRFEKEISIQEGVSAKSVGLDIFWFLHRSKGDIYTFEKYLLPIIKNASEVHCVFDGKPSPDKRQLLNEQEKKRKEIQKSIDSIESFLKYPFHHISNGDRNTIMTYLQELKRQVWKIQPLYIDNIKSWLQKHNCIIYQAESEADYLLVNLQKDNIIDVIITNDSDLLALGSDIIIKPISPYKCSILDIKYICENLELTEYLWTNFMYLCKNMKDTDIFLAYSLIKVYKDLDYINQKYYIMKQDYILKE